MSLDIETRPDFPVLDYKVIRDPLNTAIQTCINKLDREWPEDLRSNVAGNVLLESLMRANYNAFKTILFLCVDSVHGGRQPEYALSVGPLTRTLLDSLFTVVFAFEDLPKRAAWYFQSGWREMKEEHDRYEVRHRTDQQWAEWLPSHAAMLEAGRSEWGIPDSVRDNPKSVPWWPNPGRMKRDQATSAERRAFLQYMDDWFYKSLSSESHLSWPGLAWRSAALLPNQDTEVRAWRLHKQRSDNALAAIVLMLSLVSEIEIELRWGTAERLKFVWTVLNEYAGTAKGVYTARYAALL